MREYIQEMGNTPRKYTVYVIPAGYSKKSAIYRKRTIKEPDIRSVAKTSSLEAFRTLLS